MNLNELEQLARAATPGPWDTNPADVLNDELEVTASNHFVSICDAAPYDALYIAAANPETILRLVELVREMGEALESHGAVYLHHEYKYAEVLAKYKEWMK